MPFDKQSASAAGRKRWGERDPTSMRNVQLPLRISAEELEMINSKAKSTELSRVELIVRAVDKYNP